MSYLIPNPEVNPTAALVMFYKVMKGIEYDDRSWDRIHWARNMKRAKELIEIVGSFKEARICIEEVGGGLSEIDRNWKFETVLNEAHEWKAKKGINSERNARQRFYDAWAKQQSNPLNSQERKQFTGREVVDALGDIGIARRENGYEIEGRDFPDGGIGEKVHQDSVEEPANSEIEGK